MRLIVTVLTALAFFAAGVIYILFPNHLQSWVVAFFKRWPAIAKVNLFYRDTSSERYIKVIRFLGIIFIAFGALCCWIAITGR